MIVVVGSPAWRPFEPAGPVGVACSIALAAASAGSAVEIVGRIGDDAAGDALLIALARAGVGHVAVLRDPVRPTSVQLPMPEDGGSEPARARLEWAPPDPVLTAAPRLERADVALALSYLTSFQVLIVTADVEAEVIPACVDGAAFAGAQLVILVPDRAVAPDELPDSAIVLSSPAADDAFPAFVGSYAASIDRGIGPAAAFDAALGSVGGSGV